MFSKHEMYNENFEVIFDLELIVDEISWELEMNVWMNECVIEFGVKMREWRSLER